MLQHSTQALPRAGIKLLSPAFTIAAQKLANKNASPGSLHNINPAESDFFTADQVRAMSPEEVHKNYDKIRKSMEKWKE